MRERPKPASYGQMFDTKVSGAAVGSQNSARERGSAMGIASNASRMNTSEPAQAVSSGQRKNVGQSAVVGGAKVKRNNGIAASSKANAPVSEGSPGKLIKYINLDDIPDEFPESYNDRNGKYSNNTCSTNNSSKKKHASFAVADDDNDDDNYAPPTGKAPARKGTPLVQFNVKGGDDWGEEDNDDENYNDFGYGGNSGNSNSNNNSSNKKGGREYDYGDEDDDAQYSENAQDYDNNDDYGAGFKANPSMQKMQQFSFQPRQQMGKNAGNVNSYYNQAESAPNSRQSQFSANSYNEYTPSEPDSSRRRVLVDNNVKSKNNGIKFNSYDDDDDLDDWSDLHNDKTSHTQAGKSRDAPKSKKIAFEPPPLPGQNKAKHSGYENGGDSYKGAKGSASPRSNDRFVSPIIVSPKNKQPQPSVGVRYEKASDLSNFAEKNRQHNEYHNNNNNSNNNKHNSNNINQVSKVGHPPPLYNGYHVPVASNPPPLPSEVSFASKDSPTRHSEDDLAFSKAPRKVEYKPYTLDQYRVIRPKEYIEISNIKPDLNTDELIAKRSNAARVKEFANNLKKFNEKALLQAPKKVSAVEEQDIVKAQIAGESKRLKALEFAKNIPLPKNRSPDRQERDRRINDGMDDIMTSHYEGSSDSHAYKNLVDANPSVESRLAELEAKHRENMKKVEAISKRKH